MATWTKATARAELLKRKYGDSSEVTERLINLLQQNTNIYSILSYEPLAKWHEVDVSSLPERLPNIHFDIVANEKNVPFPTRKYDAVIVPLFGFNEDGYRLGHGGGWYDKFLATQPEAFIIGVGYENTRINFKIEEHDITMDCILTEQQIRYFSM